MYYNSAHQTESTAQNSPHSQHVYLDRWAPRFVIIILTDQQVWTADQPEHSTCTIGFFVKLYGLKWLSLLKSK